MFDELLCKCIFPTVRNLQRDGFCKEWFFLRYWEGGPHIRIRFLKNSYTDRVDDKIRTAVSLFMKEHPLEKELIKEEYYSNHKFDGEKQEIEKLPWYKNGSVIRFPYIPEIERYGGEQAIQVSEHIFMVSSEAVAELLKQVEDNHHKRFVIALDLMILTAFCLGVKKQDLSHFFLWYAKYWSKFVNDPENNRKQIEDSYSRQEERLQKRFKALVEFLNSSSTHPIYSQYVENLNSDCQRLENLAKQKQLYPQYENNILNSESSTLIGRVAFSQIHMTNNRLGINTNFEFNLGYFLHLITKEV